MAQAYGIKAAFMASDSPDAIEIARRLAPELRWMQVGGVDRAALSASGRGVYIETRLGHACAKSPGGCLDPGAAVRATLLDMLLLAEADALVGHMTSNLSRIALMVMAARRKKVPPFASVDGPWCRHWQACCNTTSDGRSSICPFEEDPSDDSEEA
ncbi:hypothetical protein T484DRAFT_1936029 [Baffinella frigidus]|nr:hypothetical protein T484DRAFT_1936029 [Cryptophyta sp. CCMP2293]